MARTRPSPRTQTERDSRADGTQTRERLLDIAGHVFAEKGFARTMSKEVCERAGANTAAVNYHFGSKEGLYEAVLFEAHRQIVGFDELEAIDRLGLDGPSKLRAIVELLVTKASHPLSPWGMRVLIRELMSPSAQTPSFIRGAIAPKARVVMRVLGQILELPPDDPVVQRAFAFVLMPGVMMVLMPPEARRQLLPAVDPAAPELLQDLDAFVLAGLQALRNRHRRDAARSPRPRPRSRSGRR